MPEASQAPPTSCCRDELALLGMLGAFVLALEIEALLIPLAPQRSWFSQLLHDASVHSVVAASGMAPAVWAAWGPSRLVWRLATALLAATWTFLLWQFAMQIHGWKVVGVGYAAILLTYFAWPFTILSLLRWRLGIAFECACGAAPLKPVQCQIRHLLLGVAAIGATLAAGRFAFPPEPPEFLPSLLIYACQPETQGELALNCARVMPLAMALVFRWRWLPMAALITAAAIGVGFLFDSWRASVPLASVVKSFHLGPLRFVASNLVQLLPPLLALRLLGCRVRPLTRSHAAVSR
jgi:hypothetical protein